MSAVSITARERNPQEWGEQDKKPISERKNVINTKNPMTKKNQPPNKLF
jgi:hypothetical protein